MKRRIFAWILLIGFAALFVNLVFIRYQGMISLFIYLIVVLYFLFTNKRNKGENNGE